jgi:ribosome maturation factor RimP
MITKDHIKKIVTDFIINTDQFLVDVEIKAGNVINVFVDGDNGISIGQCSKLSRHIEAQFDRDEEDFDLRVSSPGLDRPFQLKRQFLKYVGRDIAVDLKDGKPLKGKLVNYSETGLELEVKKDKKSKELVIVPVLHEDVKQAKPVISFKS